MPARKSLTKARQTKVSARKQLAQHGKTRNPETIRATLIKQSVKASSQATYTAAANTICTSLAKQRKVSTDQVHLHTITPDEYTLFMEECQNRKLSSTGTYRSAILKAQLAHNQSPWASSKQAIEEAKGAASMHQSLQRGVITPAQCNQLCTLIINSRKHFVPPCNLCWEQHRKHPARFNEKLVSNIKLQWLAKLRPGELEKIKKHSLVTTFEALRSADRNALHQSIEVHQLIFSRKNGEQLIISTDAAEHFHSLSAHLKSDDFVTARCADKHIGAALAAGATALGWSQSVTWVAHCLRHSVFTNLEAGVTKAVDNFVATVVSDTLRGTYVHNLKH